MARGCEVLGVAAQWRGQREGKHKSRLVYEGERRLARVLRSSVEYSAEDWERRAVRHRERRWLGVNLIIEWRGAGACLSALGCVEAGARR